MFSSARVRAVWFVGLFAAAATIACGLSVFGADDEVQPSADGGPNTGDGGVNNGSDDDSGGTSLSDADVSSDGPLGIDASQENCLAGCDGGSCDAGWCVYGCTETNSCTKKIVCPPGLPCAVNCTGTFACAAAVDCTSASACSIVCQGATSCNGKVTCTGASCALRCIGDLSCSGKVWCDAGQCNVACSGTGSCPEGVTCDSRTCSVDCSGPPPTIGKPTCDDGVSCHATTGCNIDCNSTSACARKGVDVISENRARVRCNGMGACGDGVTVSAGDASIECAGFGACGGTGKGIKCDGGHCFSSCESTVGDLRTCCQSTRCTNNDGTNCDLTTAGCN